MAQGYYTLEEAAQILGISTDELKQIARRGEIRSFQDRGTWRFRVQDIQEMARRRGMNSDPELPLGERADSGPKSSGPKSGPKSTGPRTPRVGTPKGNVATGSKSDKPAGTKSSLAGGPSSGPKSGPKTPPPPSREAEVFDFTLEVEDEAVDLGRDFGATGPRSGKRAKPPSSHKGPKSPAPYPDSDIRLVTDDAGIDFQIEMDSDVKLVDAPGSSAPAKLPSSAGKEPSSGKRKEPEATPADSGVRLVPMDSDSDVRITDGSDESVLLGATPERTSADSDIRLELDKSGSDSGEGFLPTEEIDLDEEIRRKEKAQQARASKLKPAQPQPPRLPTSSPFELTDSALMLPDDSDLEMPIPPPQGSDETALMPLGESSSPLEPSSSDEFHLRVPDDESTAAGEPRTPDLKGPSSGINLGNPVDSGISLEQESEGSDEIDFAINIDDESGGPSTPRVRRMASAPASTSPDDSSSEFEVALPGTEDSSSEFELALDSNEAVPALGQESGTAEESSSDFELRIDSDSPTDQESSSDFELTVDSNEEVPALESESGSEDSEFELTLDSDEGPVETVAADASSSEFELTLDSGEGEGVDLSSDSEFELTLEEDAPASAKPDSDSEFELSLDADAGLAPMESELAPLEESAELPALEEAGREEDVSEISEIQEDESGSQVVALEEEEPAADLESGDFEMQVPSDESTSEEESGSEVVALEEEDLGEEFGVGTGEKGLEGFEGLEGGDEEGGAGETTTAPAGEPVVVEKEVLVAPWGPLPVVFMLPCVVVLLLVGIMGFEMVQSMTGYKQPGLVTRTLSSLVGLEIKN